MFLYFLFVIFQTIQICFFLNVCELLKRNSLLYPVFFFLQQHFCMLSFVSVDVHNSVLLDYIYIPESMVPAHSLALSFAGYLLSLKIVSVLDVCDYVFFLLVVISSLYFSEFLLGSSQKNLFFFKLLVSFRCLTASNDVKCCILNIYLN